MSEFIKVGERIVNKPTGLDYDLINGKVYNLKWDRYNGMSYFEEDGSLSLPAKVYTTKSDDVFIKRVNTYFQKTSKLSTGVMLSGIKGTGKTVMAKVIAKNSNLPIIVVDEDYPTGRINDFFRKFETPVTIIFDEVDTGVSGDIADKMGDIMQELGTKMQVFAITHLPQIAAKGKDHYFVYKEDTDERTVTRIRKMNKEERVKEIARMLSGASLTSASIANAKELLKSKI